MANPVYVAAHIDLLIAFIASRQATWEEWERNWVGRQVRLTKDIRNDKEPTGHQTYARAGAVGTIKKLREDTGAPFLIHFEGVEFDIAPLLEKLEFLPPRTP